MSFEDVMGMLVPLTFFAMLVVEAIAPARKFPARKWWRVAGVGLFFLMGALATFAPLMLAQLAGPHRLLDLSGLGVIGGTLVGFGALTLVNFALHRAYHRSHFLWRAVHQLHHSAVRVDLAGVSVLHPMEMILVPLVQTMVTVLVLGLDPRAAALIGYIGAFYAFFQHWNVRTPQWLGYVIQRPESHCVHHGYGVHGWNYSDLPLWDMLFGTFRNPATWEGRAGFDDAPAARYGAMLAFVDVNDEMPGVTLQKA